MSQETLNTILASVIVPVLVAIVPFFCLYLNKKKEEIAAGMKDKDLVKYLNIAEDAIETAVVSVTQTFVDAIKGTDGWTPETQKQAFEQAKAQAVLIMGIAARLAIKEAYGDFDKWLEGSIEFYVSKNKTAALLPYTVTTFNNSTDNNDTPA
jgi:hypothetical protein